MELNGLCHSQFKPGPPSEEAQVLIFEISQRFFLIIVNGVGCLQYLNLVSSYSENVAWVCCFENKRVWRATKYVEKLGLKDCLDSLRRGCSIKQYCQIKHLIGNILIWRIGCL